MDSDKQWHLDKRVNIGHLAATLLLAGAVFSWGNSVDQRVTRLEAEQQSAQAERQRIYQELRSMNAKLDEINLYLRDRGNRERDRS